MTEQTAQETRVGQAGPRPVLGYAIAGPVAEDFERWRRAPRRARWLRFARRAAQQGLRRDRDRDYALQHHARLWDARP